MKPITFCANDDCRWPIYPGEKVWRAHGRLYCHSHCMVACLFPPKKEVGSK